MTAAKPLELPRLSSMLQTNIEHHDNRFCNCNICLASMTRAAVTDIITYAERDQIELLYLLIEALAQDVASLELDEADTAKVHDDLAEFIQNYRIIFASNHAAKARKH